MVQLGFLIVCLVILSAESVKAADKDEARLFADLFTKYDKRLRPVLQSSDTLEVQFGLDLLNLNYVSPSGNYLSGMFWLNFNWKDSDLTWSPADYGGIENIHVPQSDIWKPDINLYNSDSPKNLFNDNNLAVVYNDGSITIVEGASLATQSCTADFKQTGQNLTICTLKFGSWTYDGFMLNLKFDRDISEVGLSLYANHAWEVISATGKKQQVTYECCPEPYVDLTYTLKIAPGVFNRIGKSK